MGHSVVGVPKELKPQEGRVGITPEGVRTLRALGALVLVETGAGEGAGFSDRAYLDAGATLCRDVEIIYRDADMIVKVKELIPSEYYLIPLLRGKILFTYLHLAGVDPDLTHLLLTHEVTAIAYENVMRLADGRKTFPLLIPMSKIAGTQAMRGALARFPKEAYAGLSAVILGAGNVGEAALDEALAGAVGSVAVFETREERRRELAEKHRSDAGVTFFPLDALGGNGRSVLNGADIVISGVMLPGGAAAPKVLTQKHFRMMKAGCYIADVSIDQGGSTAWSRVTKPGETYTRGRRGLVFSCVPNIPGSTVPREATLALTTETLPYVEVLARHVGAHERWSGTYWALKEYPDLRQGLQTFRGFLVNEAVSSKHQVFGPYWPLDHFF